MSRTFAQANRLWFDEGRTARALRRYAHAVQERPEDPAVLFQCGVALWAVDRFDEATTRLLSARARAHALTEPGRLTLEAWLPQFVEDPPRRHYPELAPEELDSDRFTAEAPGGDWRVVADCAAERRMYGVAQIALERWGGPPLDGEDARELDAMRIEAEELLSAIRTLQQSTRTGRR
jgi:hypothetical protein